MPREMIIRDGPHEHRIAAEDSGLVSVDGTPIRVSSPTEGEVRIGEDESARAWVAADADTRWVYFEGRVYELDVEVEGRRRRTSSGHASLTAPMPATVVRVDVSVGMQVHRGDTLVILEAMKMELPIRADADGTVTSVNCKPGDLVQPDMALIELE